MEVRHNTKLLDDAIALVVRRAEIPVRQAEAAAAAIKARAIARRRLATGGAIAIAAVGIGLGVWLSLHARDKSPFVMRDPYPIPGPTVTITAEPIVVAKPAPTVTVTATPTPAPVPSFSPTPFPTSSVTVHAPVLNFTKFASQKVILFGREWDVQAGHQYATEDQKDWDAAWCYTNTDVGGIPARVDLATRPTPSSSPIGPIASSDTFQRLGLVEDQAAELASRCPWLDGRYFSPTDLVPAPNRIPSYPQPIDGVPYAGSTPSPTLSFSPQPTPNADAAAPTPSPFSVSEGYDATGNDLPGMPLESSSLEDCENSCAQTQTCNAFTFNKRHNKCFLKDKSRIIVPNVQAITGYKSNADGSRGIPVTSQLKVRAKSAVIGRFAQSMVLNSFDLCLITCEQNNISCAGVNFDMSTSECSLFSQVTGTSIAPTIESGERISR